MMIFIFFTSVMVLSSLLLALGFALGSKHLDEREKMSPFECGFSSKFSARLPFSIRFFMVALIFLIFDVELILIFPAVPATMTSYLFSWQASGFLVILILLLGLAHETYQGSLSWAN